MAETNGDHFRVTRATLALLVAIMGPVTMGAVAEYRLRQAERETSDHEERLRRIEYAITKMEQNTDALRQQNEQIDGLRKEIRELTRQMDRINLRNR